jgi:hypothetical protein
LIDKKSPDYLRSSSKEDFYSNKGTVYHEREVEVKGNDLAIVKSAAIGVKKGVMP